jgi:hypothetical protein
MAWAVIDSLNAPSSGVFDFPSLTLTGYKVLRVVISAVTVTTDGTDPRMTFYVGGSEITGTAYRWLTRSVSTSGTGNLDGASGQASGLLMGNDANFDIGNASTKSFSAVVTVNAPTDTAITVSGVFLMENAGAIDGLKVGGTSNLVAGKVRVLGLT